MRTFVKTGSRGITGRVPDVLPEGSPKWMDGSRFAFLTPNTMVLEWTQAGRTHRVGLVFQKVATYSEVADALDDAVPVPADTPVPPKA